MNGMCTVSQAQNNLTVGRHADPSILIFSPLLTCIVMVGLFVTKRELIEQQKTAENMEVPVSKSEESSCPLGLHNVADITNHQPH